MNLPRKDEQEFELYAWIGLDEYGSGELGLKQGVVPAGMIPMVSVSLEKLDKYWEQAERQARQYGKKIYLVKLVATEVVRETKDGN